MTISSTIFKNQYIGNGTNTVFAYTFKIFDEGDIAVLEGDTVKTVTTDYTVSDVGNGAGGSITFVAAPASGVIVTLKRAEPLTQEIDYTENDDFPAVAHEEGLDRSVIRDQTIQEQLDRAVTLSEGSTVTNLTFPDPTGNAEKYLRVNSAEDGYDYFSIASTGNLTVSAFGEDLIADADASEGRATLELGTAATTDSTSYATAAQGAKADTALQPASQAVLQVAEVSSGALASTTSTIPFDDTIPQISEGAEALNISFTPVSASSTIRATVTSMVDGSVAGDRIMTICKSGQTDAIGASATHALANGRTRSVTLQASEASGSTAARTYSVRYGLGVAGTMYINGSNALAKFGGTCKTVLRIEEVL